MVSIGRSRTWATPHYRSSQKSRQGTIYAAVVLGNRERQAQIPTTGVVLGPDFGASEQNLRNLLEQQRWQDADRQH